MGKMFTWGLELAMRNTTIAQRRLEADISVTKPKPSRRSGTQFLTSTQ
jgi:hypothetical protein